MRPSDIWFVVALPVYLQSELGWDYTAVGSFLALWIIGYGAVQSLAPKLTQLSGHKNPDGRTALHWALPLCFIPAFIAAGLYYSQYYPAAQQFILVDPGKLLVVGLMVYGFVFAINSSLHSYLIVAYAQRDGVSLDVGFYYMANAAGRLIGSLLSGLVYQWQGLGACMLLASGFIVAASIVSRKLPVHSAQGDT